MKSIVRIFTSLSLMSLVLSVPPASAAPADLSRLVVVGDSLSAGFQNGSLDGSQQIHGYAALVAAQAGVPLPLPLIAEPGIPAMLTLVSPGPPPVVVPAPGTSAGRVNPTVQAMDLAVPGAAVQDALALHPDCDFSPSPPLVDVLIDFVLGLPGCLTSPPTTMSQVEWAEALRPTTILVWLGNNDALGAALAADASLVTPVAAFKAAYAEVMDRLAATGATLVVANVPDVTVIPFLTSAEDVATTVGVPLDIIGPILGIGPGDFVIPDAFPLILAILANPALGPLPDSVVLTAAEVGTIRVAIADYNSVISEQAEAHGAALVDIHALLESARASGIVVGGQRLTTAFLGGFFSLDGIHPTNTGYAIIANQFIGALNRTFAAGVPPAVVREVERADPLVLPGVGQPPSALGHISPETAASLRAVLGR